MKRARSWFGTALCVAMGAAASWGAAGASDLKVVVTLKPIHSLAASVMQGVAGPQLLIDSSGSPHTFALKPSDAKAVNEAQVLIRVSEPLEPFTGKLVRSLPGTVRVVTLAEAPGLTLLPMRTGAGFEAHDHAGGKGKHGHGQSHGHAPGTGGKVEMDGHIWLDPANAKMIAAHIAEELAAAAPRHADRLRANAAELGRKLDQLGAELESALQPAAGRPYIVFHDAYQYLERRFHLAPVGAVTVSPDVPPSARRLSELRRKIETLKAACVFAEPQFAPKVIDSIVEGTPARRGTLDPLGAAIAAGPEHYFALLRALASDLKSCLSSPA